MKDTYSFWVQIKKKYLRYEYKWRFRFKQSQNIYYYSHNIRRNLLCYASVVAIQLVIFPLSTGIVSNISWFWNHVYKPFFSLLIRFNFCKFKGFVENFVGSLYQIDIINTILNQIIWILRLFGFKLNLSIDLCSWLLVFLQTLASNQVPLILETVESQARLFSTFYVLHNLPYKID